MRKMIMRRPAELDGDPLPGQWSANDRNMKHPVRYGCPRCGHIHTIRIADIDSRGNVKPLQECECGFSEEIRLGEWAQPRPRTEVPQMRVRRPYP